jgi:hypothetical protein
MKHQIAVLFLLCCIATGQVLCAEEANTPFHFIDNKEKKQLHLNYAKSQILTYQYDVIEHENVAERDKRRTAGCYVHPLYGLNGEVLTDNAPKDHVHHHGVFWTWPHVIVHEPDGKTTEYDLWTSNTALKQHFVRWISQTVTPESATFEVENGWFVGDPKDGKKIMTERVKIIVYAETAAEDSAPLKSRAIDFEFQWQPVDKPITLRGAADKSYGGFSVRFKPFVPADKKEAERSDINKITIPKGIAEGDLTETPLPWADYTSNFADNNRSGGAAIFVPKTHPAIQPATQPEWMTRYYGVLCVGYPGVKGKMFKPDEKLELRYRIWIHDGAVTVPEIEKVYGEYK